MHPLLFIVCIFAFMNIIAINLFTTMILQSERDDRDYYLFLELFLMGFYFIFCNWLIARMIKWYSMGFAMTEHFYKIFILTIISVIWHFYYFKRYNKISNINFIQFTIKTLQTHRKNLIWVFGFYYAIFYYLCTKININTNYPNIMLFDWD